MIFLVLAARLEIRLCCLAF